MFSPFRPRGVRLAPPAELPAAPPADPPAPARRAEVPLLLALFFSPILLGVLAPELLGLSRTLLALLSLVATLLIGWILRGPGDAWPLGEFDGD
jgi:hypothetical protein